MPTNLNARKRSYANYAGFVSANGGIPVKPANTVAPALSGTAEVGETLTVTNGTWTGRPTPAFTRKWLADGVEIVGATGLTHVLTEAEAGATITVEVTGASVAGSVVKASNETAVVAMAPVNAALPVITGTAQVDEVLSVSDGEWRGDATITFAYAWLADGTPIGGETAATYTVLIGDIGAVITAQVTATNSTGSTAAVSDPTEAVIAAGA